MHLETVPGSSVHHRLQGTSWAGNPGWGPTVATQYIHDEFMGTREGTLENHKSTGLTGQLEI